MNNPLLRVRLAAWPLLLTLIAGGSLSASAASGTWTNQLGTSWAATTNWNGGIIADASGNTADFSTLTLGAARTVTLDGARTIGSLIFGDLGNTYGWTLNTGTAGPLTLAVGSGSPTITVNGQTSTVGLVLAGTTGFTKLGAGTLSLSGQNTLTGTLTVSNGTLNLPTAFSGGNTAFKCATVNLTPGTALTCVYQPFGWYGNNNSGGLTININGATCQDNGCFGVAYTLTGGSLAGGSTRLDLGAQAGFNASITSYASSTTSVLSPTSQIILRTDSGETAYPFTVASGTTANGVDLDVQVPITQNGAGSGIVKNGAGVMRMDAAGNSYSGATTINAGTLLLVTNATLTASTPITIASGALFDVSTLNAGFFNVSSGRILSGGRTASPATDVNGNLAVTSGTLKPAGDNVAGTLTINGNLSLTNANLNCDLNAGAADLITLSGASRTLSLNGTTTVNSVCPSGTYTLINGFTSVNGTSANLAWSGATTIRGGPTASFNVGASSVTMTVNNSSSPASLTWQGSANGTWDVVTTANWLNGASSDYFYNMDAVTFADSPTTAAVSNSTTIYPGSVTFNNSSTAYTLRGTGSIAGGAKLAKFGSATTTLWIPGNTFNGGTVVSNGTLVLNSGASLTSGTYSPLGLGTISIAGGTFQINPGNSTGGTYTFANALAMNGGTLYEDDGVNHFTGLLTVNTGVSANLIRAHYNAKDIYLDGGMAGSGAVKISAANGGYGSGTVHVTANGTYSGTITIDNSSALNGGLFVKANNALQNATVDLETTAATDGYSGGAVNVGLTIAGSASNVTLSGLTGTSVSSYVHNGDATARTLTISNLVDNIFAGHLGDSTANGNNFALVKTGTAKLTLSGVSTYVGATTVSGGTLTGSGTLSSAVTVQSGGTLAPGGSSIGTITINSNLVLQGTAAFRINKSGATLTSDQAAGMTGVSYGGTLTVTATGDPLVAGDTFTLFNKASGSYTGSFISSNLPALSATNLAWNLNGLTNNGTISVVGVGQAVAPTFSPAAGGYIGALPVTVSASSSTIYYTTDGSDPTISGTVQTAANSVLINIPTDSSMTIKAFARVSGFADSAVVSATYYTKSNGVWTSTANGSWPVSVNWSNGVVAAGTGITADFSTLTMVSNVTVTLDGARTIGKMLFSDQGNTFNWNLNTGGGGPLTLAVATGLPEINVGNDTATLGVQLNAASGFVKTGTGTLVLTAGQSYSGPTVVSNGVLCLDAYRNMDSSPITVYSGATLQANAANALQFHGQPLTVKSGGTLTTSNGVTSNIGGHSGSLILEGGATLTSGTPDSTWGSWTFNTSDYSVLVTNGSAAAAVMNAVNMTVAGGSLTFNVADVTGDAGADLLVSGNFGTSGGATYGFIKAGTGTMELAGANTYTGTTVVNGGTLVVSGSIGTNAVTINTGSTLSGAGTINGVVTVSSGARFAPGGSSIGTLTINNNVSLSGTSLFRISKDGGSAVSDQVVGMTSLTVSGPLVVTNVTTDATLLAAGDTFTLFTTAATGSFSSLTLPALPAGLSWDTTSLLTSGSIAVVANAGPPTFSPISGSYIGPMVVTINSTTTGAKLYYTTNGNTPDITSSWGITPVSVTIPANTTITIQAYASATGLSDSMVQSATYTTISTPTWTNPSGGSWAASGDWLAGIIANGSGMTADFSTLTLSGNPATVTLDEPVIIGQLLFADQANASSWDIEAGTGGSLALNAGTNMATITVSNSTTLIGVPMTGTNGLVVNGSGTLELTGINTFTGGTIVSNGATLQLSTGNNLNGVLNGALTVNAGGSANATTANVLGYSGAHVTTLNLNGGSFTTTAAGDQGWGLTVNLTGGTLTADSGARFSAGGGWSIHTLPTNITATVSGELRLREGNPNNQLVFTVADGAAATDLLVNGPITQAASGYGIVKDGAGTMELDGANTYTGTTVVSNGTFVLNGSLATTGTVLTESGSTLTGTGTAGSVINNGNFAPGTSGIGTLTVGGALTLNNGGTTTLAIDRTAGTSTFGNASGMTSAAFGGTLTVTSLGGTYQIGDAFTLFSAGSYSGNFTATNLPGSLTAGSKWNWDPTSGILSVVASGPSGPAAITNNISGGVLTLTWPAGQGWRLVSQTNSLSTGLGTYWGTVPGVSDGSATITIDPAKPAVFYQLVNP